MSAIFSHPSGAQIVFPGGALDLPKPSRAALLDSASDWATNAEEALADIRADLDRGLVGMQLPIAKLKSAVEHLERALKEAEHAQA